MSFTSSVPDQAYVESKGLDISTAFTAARKSVIYARELAPKVSGNSASRISPIFGRGWFGFTWMDDHLYFQNVGIKPRTMQELEGKTIPMWIDDPYGYEAIANPKAEKRTTLDGRHQILIFRKVAKKGETKIAMRKKRGGGMEAREVPKSYPGAPGRINRRVTQNPLLVQGRVAGQIAKGNGGVRWRHPGLDPKGFMEAALSRAALELNIEVKPVEFSQSRSSSRIGIGI